VRRVRAGGVISRQARLQVAGFVEVRVRVARSALRFRMRRASACGVQACSVCSSVGEGVGNRCVVLCACVCGAV